jgi:hypothetical protein
MEQSDVAAAVDVDRAMRSATAARPGAGGRQGAGTVAWGVSPCIGSQGIPTACFT